MGRRGWALTIIITLVVIMTVILVAKSDELGGSAAGYHWEETPVEGTGPEKVVQLFVEGVIAEQASFTSGFESKAFISQLEQAKKDELVKAIVIRVNTPGGEVVASDEIHEKIVEVQKAGKPVIVSMGAIAASGGYYISAPADRIFANPATITGSLGVIFSLPNFKEAADKIGYKETHIKSGELKDIGDPLDELTQKEIEVFQGLVNESYMQFVAIISSGRDMPKNRVIEIADGRIYSGKQAKELGLVDEFGSLEDATQYAIKAGGLEQAQVIRYSEPFTLASLVTGIQQTRPSATDLLEGLLPTASIEPRLLFLYQP